MCFRMDRSGCSAGQEVEGAWLLRMEGDLGELSWAWGSWGAYGLTQPCGSRRKA